MLNHDQTKKVRKEKTEREREKERERERFNKRGKIQERKRLNR